VVYTENGFKFLSIRRLVGPALRGCRRILIDQRHNIVGRKQVLSDPCRHRRGCAQRLMDAAEILEHEVQVVPQFQISRRSPSSYGRHSYMFSAKHGGHNAFQRW